MITALVQRAETTDRHYDAAWTVGMIRAVAICGGLFLAAPVIAEIFAEPRSTGIIQALAVLPLLQAAASIKIAELIRKLRFRPRGIAKLTEALANTTACIALAPFWGVWALVVGTLAGPAIYMVLSYILAPHHPRLKLDRDAVASLIRYGKWIFLTGLISVTGAIVLRVLISRYLGTAELGLYFLATKISFLPSELANQVIGGVAFPLYARLQANVREATKVFRAVMTAIAVLLGPMFALMIVLAPSVVRKRARTPMGRIAPLIQWLSVAGLLGLLGDATVPVLQGLGQVKKVAFLEGLQTLLLILFSWALIGRFGLVGAGYVWNAATVGTLVWQYPVPAPRPGGPLSRASKTINCDRSCLRSRGFSSVVHRP